MFKKLKETWEAYAGPKDERLAQEEMRLNSILSKVLIVICLTSVYYGNALRRAAGMFGDASVGSRYMNAFPPETLLCLGIIASCTWVSTSMTKTGALTSDRFGETDAFPVGYFALCSGIGAELVLVGMFVVESLAQAQFVGFDGVYWMANASLAAIFASVVFVGCMVGFYLYFRRAKSNRLRIESELGE